MERWSVSKPGQVKFLKLPCWTLEAAFRRVARTSNGREDELHLIWNTKSTKADSRTSIVACLGPRIEYALYWSKHGEFSCCGHVWMKATVLNLYGAKSPNCMISFVQSTHSAVDFPTKNWTTTNAPEPAPQCQSIGSK
jgi:hypothetical protein